MRNLSIATASLALLLGTPTLAWDPQRPTAKVEAIQVSGDGSFTFYLAGSPNLCSGNKSVGIVQVGVASVTAEGARALLQAIMAAKLSGKRISTYAIYTAGNWGCSIGAVDLVD